MTTESRLMSKERGWNFDNSYARLSSKIFTLAIPEPVRLPETILFNAALAKEIGLEMDLTDAAETDQWFTGNGIPNGAEPLAQAYAGHQFGHFAMLGDGRAILLGEHISPHQQRLDIQLKGAGRTPYSRRGDGRATLRSMLREYLISEAMHGLRIPSSRSLAVATTGEKVYREEVHDGAVLTRVASSHIRVGTFEYISNFLKEEDLHVFTDYVINRHYPGIKESKNPALELLKVVMERQIDLVVHWMRVGFIHGVMNTDNMSIAGETFDYGPCAFMNAYDPRTVFSSIDTNRRYAYGNQPVIAQWNLACLAGALLPLIHADTAEAVQMAEAVLNSFPSMYEEKWTKMMGLKLGFENASSNVAEGELIRDLLAWMEKNKADYTNTFLVIQSDLKDPGELYTQPSFVQWYSNWKALMLEKRNSLEEAIQTMQSNNPAFIPRNHLVEQALDKVCFTRDFTLFNQLLEVAHAPYQNHDERHYLQTPPENGDRFYQTYCGT